MGEVVLKKTTAGYQVVRTDPEESEILSVISESHGKDTVSVGDAPDNTVQNLDKIDSTKTVEVNEENTETVQAPKEFTEYIIRIPQKLPCDKSIQEICSVKPNSETYRDSGTVNISRVPKDVVCLYPAATTDNLNRPISSENEGSEKRGTVSTAAPPTTENQSQLRRILERNENVLKNSHTGWALGYNPYLRPLLLNPPKPSSLHQQPLLTVVAEAVHGMPIDKKTSDALTPKKARQGQMWMPPGPQETHGQLWILTPSNPASVPTLLSPYPSSTVSYRIKSTEDRIFELLGRGEVIETYCTVQVNMGCRIKVHTRKNEVLSDLLTTWDRRPITSIFYEKSALDVYSESHSLNFGSFYFRAANGMPKTEVPATVRGAWSRSVGRGKFHYLAY